MCKCWEEAEGIAKMMPMFKNGAKAFWQMACNTVTEENPVRLGGWHIEESGEGMQIEWIGENGEALGKQIYELAAVIPKGLEAKENFLFEAKDAPENWPFRYLLAMAPMPPRSALAEGGLLSHLHFQYAGNIENILKDGELDPIRTVKDFLTVRQEGNRQVQRNIVHYNLDMIIALGYRVQSQVAVRFRRWATQRLHEYIQKGFAMDDERLKQGGNRYFRELLQRIRDIRSSERNFYQQVTDIYATAVDYDPRSDMTKTFFATVQNKLHYAVHENTAAEVIYNRVDNEKPFVGMTNFKGNYVTKDDVKIAKNYLSELELQRLNLLVSGFLDFAEFQALEMNPMTMRDWIEALDSQITAHKRKVLIGKGAVSHAQAIQKAEQEFEIYRQREMEMLESDFDREIKKLKEKN